MWRHVAAGLAALLCACEAPPPAPTPGAAPPRSPTAAAPLVAPESLGSSASDSTWVERVPAGTVEGARLPLIVAIHGLGDAPERFCPLFAGFRSPARVACPRGFSPRGRNGWSWFASRTGEAQQAQDIAAAADRLARSIEALRDRRGAPGPVVVTGFSQGGALAFALAVRHPELVALAVPIGGWLPVGVAPAGPGAVSRIEALHGEADVRVPLAPTQQRVAALAASGAPATLRTFPGVGHAVPPEVREAMFASIEATLDAAAKTRQEGTP